MKLKLTVPVALSFALVACSGGDGTENPAMSGADSGVTNTPDSGVTTTPDSGVGGPDTGANMGVDSGLSQDAGMLPTDAGTDFGEISEMELTRKLSTLAADEMNGRDEGTPGGLAARAWIIEELSRCGVSPAGVSGYEQPINTGNGTNVLGLVGGSDPQLRSRTIVLSAHYDHLGSCGGQICNGADDNAAGVSIVLGLACVIAQSPLPKSVLVALWDAEEPPTFLTDAMGSEFYAANPTVPLAETDAVIVLDLVGSNLWGSFAGHYYMGPELSPQVMNAVDAAAVPAGLDAYRIGLHIAEIQPTGFQPWSDYHPFRQRGVPVVFLTNGQYAHYHEPTDEIVQIDTAKMAREAVYLERVVRNLGAESQPFTFNASARDVATDVASAEATLLTALEPGGIVDSLGLSMASRDRIEIDLQNVQAAKARLQAGNTLTEAEVQEVRSAVLRLNCYGGSRYAELTCTYAL